MKEIFNQLIATAVKPYLKANTFTKTGTSFYNRKNGMIYLLNFQGSQGNSAAETRFYINCGMHATDMDQVLGITLPAAPKEYDCWYRARIADLVPDALDYYSISHKTDLDALQTKLLQDVAAVVQAYSSIVTTTDLIDLMIARNGLQHYDQLFLYLLKTNDDSRLKIFSRQLHQHFGSEKRWTIFEDKMNALLLENERGQTFADLL